MKSNQKGLFITTDAFVGLTLVFVLILASMVFLSQVSFNSWNSIDLIIASRDQATVLEKNEVLENSIKQNSSEPINSELINTPQNLCFEVNIFSNNNLDLPILSSIKPGCVKYFKEYSSNERTIIINEDNQVSFYIARVGVWYQ